MALKRVGYFLELHNEPDLPSIHEAVRSVGHPEEAHILSYLDAGIALAGAGGVQKDAVDPSKGYVTSPDIMTDGVWTWPGELEYYVRNYHIELPNEFVEHMRHSGWMVPELSKREITELCHEFFHKDADR